MTRPMEVSEVIAILESEFPNAKSDLDFKNPFELLIAVTLSAQTTDAAVNKVTPALFRDYPTAEALSLASSQEIEPYLRTIGLYRNKSKFIVQCAQKLMSDFEGVVPANRIQLMSLPGVGRKTANVVLAVGFNIPAIAVDTHVDRVAKRLKLAKANDSVEVVEQKLMRKIPREDWARAHHLLLLFGRYISTAHNQEDAYSLLFELKEKHRL